ncbi:MAG TPA: hypothetical protein VFQ53_11945 [Kofleriaceae bacterium]|nr:hypothetical protein [Kofleriaceae bacterium]
MRAFALACIAFVVAACGDNIRGNITIHSTGAFHDVLVEYARETAYPIRVVEDDTRDTGFHITVVEDATLPAQSYQLIARPDEGYTVVAPDLLGAQYGVTAALEAMGFRFRHPYDTFVPTEPTLGAVDDEVHQPEIRVRGVQLHTLHPIEGYFAFWEPSFANLNDAKLVIDWLIKNRGNYLQWVALDDIINSSERYLAWRPFTRELIDYAHARGIRVGINIQLFGQSNLQLAYDLVDQDPADKPIPDQIAQRLPGITTDLPWDVVDLSFGEFFNADPQVFVDSVNEVKNQLAVKAPNTEMHAVIHVGAEQRVTYMGEDLLYYFLVKYADPSIISDVHTVMFYDLFEPTGGAYHHEDFSEHRAFLLERMCSGQKVAYFPETAYWVAFDNSVPQFFPLYVKNRWIDLHELAAQPGCAPLDEHLLFSSGWEWSYWLHDTTALHASYELPDTPEQLLADALSPDLADAVAPIARLIETQRAYLMLGNLVAYIAGRDTAIDAGRQLGIVSQPDRVVFDDLIMGLEDPAVFQTTVLDPLAAYADELDDIARELDRADLPDNKWARELRDGLAIDRLRARFVLETYGATLAHVAGDDRAALDHFDRADQLMADGQTVVDRRHDDLHDALGERSISETENQTFYQFGYLYMADTLCYWRRELLQVGAILGSTTASVPSCLF